MRVVHYLLLFFVLFLTPVFAESFGPVFVLPANDSLRAAGFSDFYELTLDYRYVVETNQSIGNVTQVMIIGGNVEQQAVIISTNGVGRTCFPDETTQTTNLTFFIQATNVSANSTMLTASAIVSFQNMTSISRFSLVDVEDDSDDNKTNKTKSNESNPNKPVIVAYEYNITVGNGTNKTITRYYNANNTHLNISERDFNKTIGAKPSQIASYSYNITQPNGTVITVTRYYNINHNVTDQWGIMKNQTNQSNRSESWNQSKPSNKSIKPNKTIDYNTSGNETDLPGKSEKRGFFSSIGQWFKNMFGAKVSETVRCDFNQSTTNQSCQSASFTCSGVENCKVEISGKNLTSMSWKSSCGGYQKNLLDGQNDIISFNCSAEQ
ncbi:MAG TPA: hypothetical protein VK158_05515 [Acidobacteriota bacterium]|nr:hypothetical protein [Acidobacteriota bacterium]